MVGRSVYATAVMIDNDYENIVLNVTIDDHLDKNASVHGNESQWLLAEWMFTLSVKQLFYCIFYSTITVLALGGNGVIIYMIATFRQMRTVTNIFILNLALGDLLMAVLCIPFTFTADFLFHAWPFGPVMCHVVSYAQAVSVFISAYTLVAISIDRFIAIIYPLRPRLTRRHSLYAISFVWLISLLTPLPTAFFSQLEKQSSNHTLENSTTLGHLDQANSSLQDSIGLTQSRLGKTSTPAPLSEANVSLASLGDTYSCVENWSPVHYKTYYSLLLMILQYWLPFTVLVFTYTKIALVVWGKKTPGEAYDGRDARIAASKRKMVKMMIACVLAFTLCWLPFNLLILVMDVIPELSQYEYMDLIYFACHWLAMSHASYNPIIYIWMNARFRYGFRYVIAQCSPCLSSATRRRGRHSRVNGQHANGQSAAIVLNSSLGKARENRSTQRSSNQCSFGQQNSPANLCQMTTMIVNN